jgi:hypothetical protein
MLTDEEQVCIQQMRSKGHAVVVYNAGELRHTGVYTARDLERVMIDTASDHLTSWRLSADRGLDDEELRDAYGGYPDGHPDYTISDWRDAAACETTLLGYWEWLHEQLT